MVDGADPEAARLRISPLDILRDVLLHCGGLGNLNEIREVIVRRCEDSLRRLISRRTSVRIRIPIVSAPIAKSARVTRVDDTTALSLHRGLHYLGSPRPGGTHLGLFAQAPGHSEPVLLCLASINAFDLHHLVPRLISPREAKCSLVLSRLLSLPGAPHNAMSRLLGGVFLWLRNHQSSVEALLSYNNPNLGFLGTVYKATNWQLIGVDAKRPDMTLDGEYISLRELKARFGSFEFTDLRKKLGARLELMPAMQRPLEVYMHQLPRRFHSEPLVLE